MSGRLVTAHLCKRCGTSFHPWPGSRRLYCSPECWQSQQKAEAAERRRTEKEAERERRNRPPTPGERAVALRIRDEMVAALASAKERAT